MLWLSLLYFFLPSGSDAKIQKEIECVSNYGWEGYCRPSWDCLEIGNLISTGFQPEFCGSSTSLYCCPVSKPQRVPKPKRRISSIFLKAFAPDDEDTLVRISAVRSPLKRRKRRPVISQYKPYQGFIQSLETPSYISEINENEKKDELATVTENYEEEETVAVRKCKEYDVYAWEKISEYSPYGGVVPVTQEYCPRNRKEPISIASELPFMVGLGYEDVSNQIVWGCSGTLISKDYILTAAHCLQPPMGRPKLVRLGTPHLDLRGHGEEIDVAEVIINPYYNPADRIANLAIIKLKSIPNLGTHLRPGCLLTNSSGSLLVPFWKKDPTVALTYMTGDNEVQYYTDEGAVALHKSVAAEVNITTCGGSENENEKYSCIESTSEGFCQTVSEGGEPLIQLDRYNPCLHKIIGVAVDKSCSNEGPTLYTRIDPYLDWIEKTVWH